MHNKFVFKETLVAGSSKALLDSSYYILGQPAAFKLRLHCLPKVNLHLG